MANFNSGALDEIVSKAKEFEKIEEFVNSKEPIRNMVNKIVEENKKEGKEISFQEAVTIAFTSILVQGAKTFKETQSINKIVESIKDRATEIQEEIKDNIEKYNGKDVLEQSRLKGWMESLTWEMKKIVELLSVNREAPAVPPEVESEEK